MPGLKKSAPIPAGQPADSPAEAAEERPVPEPVEEPTEEPAPGGRQTYLCQGTPGQPIEVSGLGQLKHLWPGSLYRLRPTRRTVKALVKEGVLNAL